MADFSQIAPYYDLMTGFKNRLVNEFGILKHLVEKFEIRNALDAGCGTGVHTIILSKIGVDVTGLDSSPEMLEMARTNALREGVEPPFELEYFESMPNTWTGKFDAVFCLANSLVGVETAERLSLAFKAFYRVLKPGGKAIIQVLNFVKFRRDNQRIIKISNSENMTFVRFFDFEKRATRLNVIIIEHEMGEVTHKFSSQKILPVNDEVLTVAANIARFSKIELYTDLSLTESASADSKDLVALLIK